MEGLEPTRLAALDPKSSMSTNFTTSALHIFNLRLKMVFHLTFIVLKAIAKITIFLLLPYLERFFLKELKNHPFRKVTIYQHLLALLYIPCTFVVQLKRIKICIALNQKNFLFQKYTTCC